MSTFTSNIPMIINNISTMSDVSAQNIELSGNIIVDGSGTFDSLNSVTLSVSGNSSVGTLGVTGLATFSGGISGENFSVADTTGNTIVGGTLNANGGITCDTNKFVVANDTGNTIVGGTLDVTGTTTVTGTLNANGGITCDTNKFVVADTTGNTTIGGTLGVTGLLTATGGISGDTSISGTLSLKSSATSSTSTQIPVFITDPSTTAQTLVTRTPTEFRGDIGALSVVNMGITGGSSSGPVITNSAGTDATIPAASSTASGIVTTGTQTISGTKTFSSTITANISGSAGSAGSAGSVTNGVYTTNDQTISGTKTFSSSTGVYIDSGSSNWRIKTNTATAGFTYYKFNFKAPNDKTYYISSVNNTLINFTGQHRTFIKDIPYTSISNEYIGRIVCADQNTNISMSGSIKKGNQAITQNETLPYCSLACKDRDKSCFGVISESEDPNERVDKYGAFCTPFEKEDGDTRIYINSVGEGALWITNKNGSLESGDYITTCDLSGYGMKQDSEFLANYTVAKITMDCDFNPVYQPVPTILKDASGENILDEQDQIQWTDLVDSSGNIVYEYAYNIRYLNASSEIIDKETYDMSGGFIAAYVGCTYHCG